MPELAQVRAPFTEDQLDSLAEFQYSDTVHPYTCPQDHDWCDYCREAGAPPLSALLEEGLTCACTGCDYTQDWVHAFAADWSWRRRGRPA